jgi:hypothetical protein
MATMIVKHKVASFESWKQAFDGMTQERKKHGWLGHIVLRDATDPNVVTIVNRVRTLDGAKAYGGSAELRTAMQKAGVLSAPEISFLDDAEELKY